MVVCIAGSRELYPKWGLLYDKLREIDFDSTRDRIISGGARGVDSVAREFAKELELDFEEYPAQWYKYGKSAGFKRNLLMGKVADILILIWDGKSKGSKMMKDIMTSLKKPIIEVIL
jgi:hypothetical protein